MTIDTAVVSLIGWNHKNVGLGRSLPQSCSEFAKYLTNCYLNHLSLSPHPQLQPSDYFSQVSGENTMSVHTAMWNTAASNCQNNGCTGSNWYILRNGTEVALPVKFGQTGMDLMIIDSGFQAMLIYSQRSVQQIYFDDTPHGSSLNAICQMSCPP